METAISKVEPKQTEQLVKADPIQVIRQAQIIAEELKKIVVHAKLVSKISGRDYVQVEGWTSMLSMLGITPATAYSRRLERDGEVAYEARVELHTLHGDLVGAGEAMCSSKEKNWSNRDEFAIRSMAQTRATGKAARLSYSWIMKLAGFEATPAEEMIAVESESAIFDNSGAPKNGKTLSEPQLKRLFAISKKHGWKDEEIKELLKARFGGVQSKDLTRQQYDTLCQLLESEMAPNKKVTA